MVCRKSSKFYPYVSGNDPEVHLFRIYNRWGQLIYQTQIKGMGWDGTFKEKTVKTDTYIWTLTTKYKDGETRKEYRGHINMLK